jgi:hypothetical protein
MESTSVMALVKEINETRTQTSASNKDEIRVMRAMLNDPTFKVDVYSRSGVEGQYCPYEDARTMISNIIRDTTKISSKEATDLAASYEFGKQEAATMIGISKEFINTYIETGRKLPLGGRETSNISIAKKTKEARSNSFPKKVGINDDGSDRYETVDDGVIPAHGSLKVYSSAPSWLTKK